MTESRSMSQREEEDRKIFFDRLRSSITDAGRPYFKLNITQKSCQVLNSCLWCNVHIWHCTVVRQPFLTRQVWLFECECEGDCDVNASCISSKPGKSPQAWLVMACWCSKDEVYEPMSLFWLEAVIILLTLLMCWRIVHVFLEYAHG